MKKILTLCIIVLFLIVGVNPSSALDTVKDSNQSIQDEYKEIITIIKGYAELNWIDRNGFFRGEVNITLSNMVSIINLSGFRRYQAGIEYFEESVEFVYVSHFLGFSPDYSIPEFAPTVIGIAIGDIEWR